MILGPALAGILIARSGLATVYLLDLVTYIVSFISIYFINTRFALEPKTESIVRSIKVGFRYAISNQILIGSYAVDFIAMIFGMPMALFPAIAIHTFHSVTAVGWLYAGPSIGLLAASILSGWVDKIKRHGVAIALSAALWGAAIIAFGLTSNLYLAISFLAIAGAADAVSGLFRVTLWNQTVPTNLRGRMAGIEMISYMSGPLLGNAEAGMVAAAFGTTFSVISGGALCVIGVIVLIFTLPKFWQYTAPDYSQQKELATN